MWSIAAAQDALSRYQFIKISSISPPTRITVQDLPRLWGEDPTAVAHIGYRIAGPLEDVTTALGEVLLADQVDAVISTMLNKDNYSTTMAEMYQDELQKFTTWNRNITVYQANAPGQLSLFNIVRQLDPSVGINSNNQVQKQKQKGARKKSLQEKIANLGIGKIIDVSKLQEDGTGYKTVNMPKRLGNRFYVRSIPIISDDLAHYLRALSQLPGGYQSHLPEISALNDHNSMLMVMRGQQPVSLFQILNLPTPTSATPLVEQVAVAETPARPVQAIASTPSAQSAVFAPVAQYFPSWKARKRSEEQQQQQYLQQQQYPQQYLQQQQYPQQQYLQQQQYPQQQQ